VPNNWDNRPGVVTRHGRAIWHSPLGWLAGCAGFSWPSCASQHGEPMLDRWDLRTTLSDLFRSFKLTSLALLSAKYCPPFRSFDKVPENTKRCYMSKMYAKEAGLTLS